MSDYWIPETKRELVETLAQHYPSERGKFGQMKKKQLYAIYFEVRERGLRIKH